MRRGAGEHDGWRSSRRYDIVGTLGIGGMGVVVEAFDRVRRRPVALKFVRAEPHATRATRARLAHEAEAMTRARHPRVCAAYGVGRCDGCACLVMPRLVGETLQARIARGPLDPFEAIHVAADVAAALAAVHRAGLVHQDVKPANLFVTATGRITLLDFGLAVACGALAHGGRRGRPSVLGTANYIAPERILQWPADPRSDLFSLGAVMYEMAAGHPPFRGESAADALADVLDSDPPAIEGARPPVARSLDRLIRTLLQKDPERRCQSASSLRRALLLLGGRPASSARSSRHSPFRGGVRHASLDVSCAHVH